MSYRMLPGAVPRTQYPSVPGTFPTHYPSAPGTQFPTQVTLPPSGWYGPPPQKDAQWQSPENDVQQQLPEKVDYHRQVYRYAADYLQRLQVTSKHVFISLVVLLMFLILFVPVWNCLGLLQDPTYVYLVETEKVSVLIAMCAILFCVSTITLVVYLNIAPYNSRTTPQNMFMMGSIFLSSLGIILILCGLPIQSEVSAASKAIYETCRSSPKSGIISLSFKDLQRIRAEPTCAKMDSIERCPAFATYTEASLGLKSARVVKNIETTYHCSGYCEDKDANGRRIYPPSLFSETNYKISCDGMVMRHLDGFVHDLADQMVVQGVFLVASAVAISFGMLLGFCSWPKRSETKESDVDYGATS